MTDLRIVRTEEYPDPALYPDILFKIPVEKRDVIAGYKNEKARRQSASAWLLLADMLAEREIELANLHVILGPQGKPHVDGIHFSLSHSGDYVLCAVSDAPIGADIQIAQGRTAQRIDRLVDRFFAAPEKAAMERLKGEPAEYEKMFFKIFSCKEAFIKCTGEGLSRDLRDFVTPFALDADEAIIDGITYRFEVREYGRYRNRGENQRGEGKAEKDYLHESCVEDYYCSACCSAVLPDYVLRDGKPGK